MEQHRFPAANHRASRRTRRRHSVVFVATLQLLFSWKTTFGGFQPGRNTAAGGAQSVERHMTGERPTDKQVSVPVRQRLLKHMRHSKVCVKT